MTKQETKSPIKNLPVRMPGQSLREKLDTLFEERVLPVMMGVMIAVLFAVLEWINYAMNAPRRPWAYTVGAAIVAVWGTLRIRRLIREARNLNLGRIGEEAVGQFLEEKVRPMGCQVLHDVPADRFNIDHIVVGPSGVFAIETKTHSKPAKGICKVTYDGETVAVNGMTPERDPVVQGKAQARWVSDLIEQSTGRRCFVQPVVVYPGWFVETTVPGPDVWVINDTVLPTFIKNARHDLPAEDVALITYHLKRYVISHDKAKKG